MHFLQQFFLIQEVWDMKNGAFSALIKMLHIKKKTPTNLHLIPSIILTVLRRSV